MSPLLALPLALALALAAVPAGCPEPSAASAPLAGWCASLAARPRLPLPTRADRAALRAVYERPELRRARADTAGFRRLLSGLWGRLLELLGSTEAERYASVGRTAFLVAGLAAAAAGLAALRRRRPAGPRARAGAEAERATLPPPDRSAALAAAALAAGNPTGAVRHAFLSALAALELGGLLPRDRTLTNRELAGRLAGGALAAEFDALGRLFDGAVYGGAPVGEEQARAGLAAAGRLRAAAGGGA